MYYIFYSPQASLIGTIAGIIFLIALIFYIKRDIKLNSPKKASEIVVKERHYIGDNWRYDVKVLVVAIAIFAAFIYIGIATS